MRRAIRSLPVRVFAFAGTFASFVVACSPADPSTATADECAQYTSCGACTPILGCGWCDHADGTSVCSNDPDVCLGNGRWTWEPTPTPDALGCPTSPPPPTPDSGPADTPTVDAPKPDDGHPLEGIVRILGEWTDDARTGAAPVSPLEVAPYGSTTTSPTNAAGEFVVADASRGGPFVWIDVLDPRGEEAESIAGVSTGSSAVVVSAFPASLVADGAKHFVGAGSGGGVLLVRVVDAGGQPLAGAHLAPIVGAGAAVYDSGIDLAAGDVTGSRGIAGVFGVPAGSALVRVDRSGRVTTIDAPTAAGAVTSFTLTL